MSALPVPGSDSYNVAGHLADMALRYPNRLAVIYPETRDRRGRVAYTHYTFAQLQRESDAIAHGLRSVGIGPGTRTILMVSPSLEFFTLTFALFKLEAIPILIDPGMGIRNLGRCLAEAKPEAFIGIPKAHLARRIFRWGIRTLRVSVTTGSRLLGGDFRLDRVREIGLKDGSFPPPRSSRDQMAAILFTSGSTGVAKGTVYTHGIFHAQVGCLQKVYGIESGEIDLATFPLFALFAPALGMTAIIPDMDPTKPAEVDPRKIIEAVENFGVTNLFGSPALINRVGRYAVENAIQLPSLRRVISAGAPVPAKVIERFTRVLVHPAQVHTPYGATEALPVASIASDVLLQETRHATDRGEGVCVGSPVPGIDVRILPIRDEPIPRMTEMICLPQRTIGEITVTGPVVTKEYDHLPAATALAKSVSDDGRVWHRMGDLGYLDEQGRIWFCGRKTQRVECADATLFTIPCEAIFNTHPDVFRSALVGVKRLGVTWPVICIEREKGILPRPDAILLTELQTLASKYPHTARIKTFLFHSGFPVDIRHNAKIFREKLAVWADRELARRGWDPRASTPSGHSQESRS